MNRENFLKRIKRSVKRKQGVWFRSQTHLSFRRKAERKLLFEKRKRQGINNIPIFIISYNRLSFLKNLINTLESREYTNIIIIDNHSTYEPLLEYYKQISYEVIYQDDNYGHMAFWKNPLFDKYRNDFYVVTDPDVEPLEECPNDFLIVFLELLEKYPRVRKVGFSLKIDDLPKSSPTSEDVVLWESQYFRHSIEDNHAYIADIDTTFALYLPDKLIINKNFYSALRTAKPYQARHLPWYKTEEKINEEDEYYSKSQIYGWWDPAEKKMTFNGKESVK